MLKNIYCFFFSQENVVLFLEGKLEQENDKKKLMVLFQKVFRIKMQNIGPILVLDPLQYNSQ